MLTSRSQIWYTIFVGPFGAPRHLPGLPLISYATAAVTNIMPLIQFMALIQRNVSLDINYASKQRTCVH